MDNSIDKPFGGPQAAKDGPVFPPKAVLSGKVMTLAFDCCIEAAEPALFNKRECIGVACGGEGTFVTSVKIDASRVIIGIAEYFSPSDGTVTVSYKKPGHGALRAAGTDELIQSFEDVAADNTNPEISRPKNLQGFRVENVRSLKDMTGAAVASDFPSWGGHQSRIVRTENGVYITTLIASPPKTHKFGLYKADEPGLGLIGEEFISGVAVTVLADSGGNVYVPCLDAQEGDMFYGRPTVFKYPGGRGPAVKIQYQADEFKSGNRNNELCGYNYEGACMDGEGKNILMAISYVDNDEPFASKLVWLTFDTVRETWSGIHSEPVKWSELYPYVLSWRGGGKFLTNVACSYRQLGHGQPAGYDPKYIWFGVTLWDLPEAGGGKIDEIWRCRMEYTDSSPAPFASQNGLYSGDAYIDSKGYTHLLLNTDGALGIDTHPAQTRYVIFDSDNKMLLDRHLFDGVNACRFAETPGGVMYILRMVIGTSKYEVYAVNVSHTDISSGTPVFTHRFADKDGKPYITAHSGPCITAPRGGSAPEWFTDVAFPRKNENPDADSAGFVDDWIIFRLHFPT